MRDYGAQDPTKPPFKTLVPSLFSFDFSLSLFLLQFLGFVDCSDRLDSSQEESVPASALQRTELQCCQCAGDIFCVSGILFQSWFCMCKIVNEGSCIWTT